MSSVQTLQKRVEDLVQLRNELLQEIKSAENQLEQFNGQNPELIQRKEQLNEDLYKVNYELVTAYKSLESLKSNIASIGNFDITASPAVRGGGGPNAVPQLHTNLVSGPVYGLPPVFNDSPDYYKKILTNSMFIIQMSPITTYLTTYALTSYTPRKLRTKSYTEVVNLINQILGDVGATSSSYTWYTFAVQATRVTETLSNTFSESYWQTEFNEKSSQKGATLYQYYRGAITNNTEGTPGQLVDLIRKAKQGLGKLLTSGKLRTMGAKIDFPKIWSGSSWAADSNTYTMKFISPTSNPEDILNWVIKPVYLLKILASPLSEDGGDTFNAPPFLRVRIPYVVEFEYAGISSLDITWGGEIGAFSMDQLPLMADVSVQFESAFTANVTILGTNNDLGKIPTTRKAYNFIQKGFNDTNKGGQVYAGFEQFSRGISGTGPVAGKPNPGYPTQQESSNNNRINQLTNGYSNLSKF